MMAVKKQKKNIGKKIAPKIPEAKMVKFEHPVFSFKSMRNNKYHLDDCKLDKDKKSAFASKLVELSRLTWIQLQQAPRHGLGYEKIAQDAIKGDSTSWLTDDVTLLAFRCYGNAPMVGYKDDNGIFHVIWLDHDFTLYDHD